MSEIRFYIDENISPAVAQQLVMGGIDAVSAHSLEVLGESDEQQFQRAIEMGRVLCTQDEDFMQLAADFPEHTGILFGHHVDSTIGRWVNALRKIHGEVTAEEMIGQFRYLKLK